ncbi:MAG: CotH kinase family protein, partial [Mariprofundaceae bacterium]
KMEPLFFFKKTGNLSAGAGLKFDKVGWVGENESATVVDSKGAWRRVNMTISGKLGWVQRSQLLMALPTGEIIFDTAKAASSDNADGQYVEAFLQLEQGRILNTAILRREPEIKADVVDWVGRGELVTIREKQHGWIKVLPHMIGRHAGWIRIDDLKEIHTDRTGRFIFKPTKVENRYSDRMTDSETFNYSYAALQQARYPVSVEEINVTLTKEDLQSLERKDTYDRSTFAVNILHDKRKLRGTIQVLGSSTRLFNKKALRIKLDKEGGRWYGRRNIALQAMGSDKSMMRNFLSWKLAAAMGMKVPEVHFTRVNFNHGEKIGLYLSIEWMDAVFFDRHGFEAKGAFYQPTDENFCGDLYSSVNMENCFEKIFPQDGDYRELSEMGKHINAASTEEMDKTMAKYFDDESVLNWLAVNALVTNGDTYNKNYWLYHNPHGGKWMIIPWDYNLTFGRTFDPYEVMPFSVFNENFQYYYGPDVGAGNPLKDKSLRNPVLRARLEAKIKHLIGMQANGPEETFGWFSPKVMEARIASLATVLNKQLGDESFISYGERDFKLMYQSVMHYIESHDYFLKYKLFGDFEWNPEPPNQPLIDFPLPETLQAEGVMKKGQQRLHLEDRGWAYFVADLHVEPIASADIKFRASVDGGLTPVYLPPAQLPTLCIKRSWIVTNMTPATSVDAALKFEYIQENSHRSEVPVNLHEELLQLWQLDDDHWIPLQTEVNPYANTVMAKGVTLKYGHSKRFVACSPF